ncbi:MAG: hypothetical protein E7266_06145 [Lachnospiraceae bacterium]|nr:hypothetical protein [Lachnospiraceae bacterium]
MEQNVTLQPEVKKPYNVFLMLAGIAIALYGLINMFSIIYRNILMPIFYGYSELYFTNLFSHPITLFIGIILPIIYSLVLLLFAVFLCIGKPKFVFPIFSAIMLIYNVICISSNLIRTFEYINNYHHWLDSAYQRISFLCDVINYILSITSETVLFVAISTALICIIMALCNKQLKFMWLVPGIIAAIRGILEILVLLYETFGYQIIYNILYSHAYYYSFTDIFTIMVSFALCVIISISLALHFFFLGKGLSKEA